MEEIKIGVLAIQGSFREHAALVKRAHPNATAVEVRKGEPTLWVPRIDRSRG